MASVSVLLTFGYSLDFSITFYMGLWNSLPGGAKNTQQNAPAFPDHQKHEANDIVFFLGYPA